MDIKYIPERNIISIDNSFAVAGQQLEVRPAELLDALDECLLLKIKQLKLHKITKMTEYIKRHEELAEQAKKATTRLELAKLSTEKLILKEIRHAVKLMEMEEKAIKTEMLERQVK